MKKIKQFFQFIKYIYHNLKYRRLNKKLSKVAKSKKLDRLKLSYEVGKYIRKFAKVDKDNKSKYIPLDFATRELIKHNVNEKFGQKMFKLNVRLNRKLQVI
jgi:hypothetical protein